MISIFIAMPVLVTLATGLMECNLSQHDTKRQCYGALGEPLIFNFPNFSRMKLKKAKDVIKMSVNSTYGTFNDTFEFSSTTKNNSGDYQLELYDKKGKNTKIININLKILASVSQPALLSTCLAPELRTINFSADGDDIEFSFSLDDNLLIETKAVREKKESSSISLNGQLAGNLRCKVQNKVSSKQTVIYLTSCQGPHSITLTVLASLNFPLLLLILLLAVKLCKIKRPTSLKEDDTDDNIVYSDIRVIRAARKLAA